MWLSELLAFSFFIHLFNNYIQRFPNKPGVDLGPTADDEVFDFKTKEGATKSELVAEESDTDIIDRAPQEQTNHDRSTSVDGAHKNDRRDMLSALGLGEEEDIESPWDSKSISESLPQKYVDHLSRTAGERGKKTLNGQPAVRMKDYVPNKTVRMKDLQTSGSELDLEMISEEKQEKLDGDENNLSQVEEEKKHKSSEVEISDNVCDAADESGLIQQRKSGGNSNQEFPAMENEDSDSNPGVHRKKVKKKNNDKRTPEECMIAPVFEKTESLTGGLLHVNDDSILREVDQDDDRPARKTPYEKKKVKEQMNYVNDLDDLTQSSEMVSEDGNALHSANSTLQVEPLDLGCKDSGSLLKIQDAIFSHDRLVNFQRKHCELLRGEIHKMKSKFCGLQKELSETKEVKSQLEHQKVEWEREHRSLRFTLNQEEENRRNSNMLYEKIREQGIHSPARYPSQIQTGSHPQGPTSRSPATESSQGELRKASAGPEEPKDLLCKNHMLQDEIAMLRLEIEAMKNQNLEKEKNYFEDIEIVKAKNDDAQNTIKLNEERLTKTISQYIDQLNVLTAENTMLKSKLENEKENKQRLETEVESYRSRLAAAFHDHDQGQTSQRDLELAFQKAEEEWLCLHDKMKSDVANLKDKNEALSQQLSTAESKFHQVKIKLQHTRDNLRETILMLERVQRDLCQAECQKQEIEHLYLNEQGKVNKYLGKQDSLEETLSQLRSENMLLRQQLDDAQNKANSKEKTVISIQDQYLQIMRKLQAESEKQGLMLEERNKELIQERNHLKERMYQYKNEKAEREAVVRQLQQELAEKDALKKKSMSEASLESMSNCAKLEAETQDLKNNIHQPTSQIQARSQQMELRIKDLESELSKMKTLQEDSNKDELEKYKHLYLVKLEVRKSLKDKLDKTDERLTEISTELEVEKQNRSIHSTLSTRPVLESSPVGNFNPASGFNTNVISRANRGFSTSIPCRSNDSIETYLTKMQQELDRSITREIRKVDAEFASDAFTVSHVSADGSNVYDDQILKTKAQYTQILKEKHMI
ncbi:hypothetical protein E5288_WYG004021 [Bos mutus]|uniref:Ankyrin repeat domain-containing protein 26 n=1 Tax=Bos mutus TaxID=72004 RepID=A0A6B0RVU5_9CETA|nr:hypothetical protein [Bos mutus]